MSEPLYYDPKTGEPTGKTIGWLRDIYYSTRAVECTTTSREAFGELARELARLQRERDEAVRSRDIEKECFRVTNAACKSALDQRDAALARIEKALVILLFRGNGMSDVSIMDRALAALMEVKS